MSLLLHSDGNQKPKQVNAPKHRLEYVMCPCEYNKQMCCAAAAVSQQALTQTAPVPQLASLLIQCPDQKGVVAALAQLLYGFGCNILESDQYTDQTNSTYFQR